jgi:DNA polymerase phi
LETKESSRENQDLFEVDEIVDDTIEDDDENHQNGDVSSSASDVELLDSEVEEVSEKSLSEEEHSDGEDDGDDAELEAFEAKLAAALGTRKGQDDLEAEDTEGSDDDMYEDDMDEEEMEALDEKLGEVFRARKPATNKKQERKDTKEAIVNLKRRVLDLIEVYFRQEHLNPLALDLVLPLITTARTTSVKQISDRAHDILQAFCIKCKGSNLPAVEDDTTATVKILDALKMVHEEAGLDHARAHATACSRASILLVKVLIKAQVSIGEMVDVYADTRKKQLSDLHCKVQPSFFTEWNNWCTSARDQLVKGGTRSSRG